MLRPATCFLLLTLSLSLAACDSGGDDDIDPIALGSMTATVGGSSWNAANATANVITVAGNRTLAISGATVGTQITTMTLTITAIGGAAIGTGTYSLSDEVTDNVFGSATYLPTFNPGDAYASTAGTVTISEIDDDHVEGTFSFTGQVAASGETITVADGRFNVGYGPPVMP